jgi:cytochrome b subunit of formate dehydrogenase
MDSIAEMPNRKDIQWFDNGTYQGGTKRGYPAVHIYDKDKQVIAVFQKSTVQFTTTCQLTPAEEQELFKTGNFGGEK